MYTFIETNDRKELFRDCSTTLSREDVLETTTKYAYKIRK